MAQKVLILGNSGTGKSTSIRNLNPDETFIIKCVEKPLPFKKSEKLYCAEKKMFLLLLISLKFLEL